MPKERFGIGCSWLFGRVLSVLKSPMRCLLGTAIYYCEPLVLLHILLQFFHWLTHEEKDLFSTSGLILMNGHVQHTTKVQGLIQDKSDSLFALLLALCLRWKSVPVALPHTCLLCPTRSQGRFSWWVKILGNYHHCCMEFWDKNFYLRIDRIWGIFPTCLFFPCLSAAICFITHFGIYVP